MTYSSLPFGDLGMVYITHKNGDFGDGLSLGLGIPTWTKFATKNFLAWPISEESSLHVLSPFFHIPFFGQIPYSHSHVPLKPYLPFVLESFVKDMKYDEIHVLNCFELFWCWLWLSLIDGWTVNSQCFMVSPKLCRGSLSVLSKALGRGTGTRVFRRLSPCSRGINKI
jgi:hypothetical protein